MSSNTPNLALAPANMAQVIQIIERDTTLSDTTRRDLVSSVRRAATMLDCDPRDLHANVASLRQKLLLVHPAMHDITAKSFANIKANLARALVHVGVIPVSPKPKERTPAWVEFLGHADARHQVIGLSRFVAYCMRHGIEPSDVSDDAVREYRQFLDHTLLANNPEKVCKETVKTWNCIVKRAALDFARLSPITPPRFRAKPLSAYLPSLQQDIKAYTDRLAHVDPFEEDGPTKPLRPTSIRNVRAHICQYLDALIASGCAIGSFRELADIVHPNAIKAGFGVIIERNGGEPPVGLKNVAGTLLAIARYHVKAPDDQIAFLKKTKSRLAETTGGSDYGMSEKNVVRLSQFDDWRNVVRLIALPEELLARAKANPDSRRSALDVMYAVAIAILLACPMRARNLADLDLSRHITTRREGSKVRYAIRIEGREVKNLTSIDVDLDAHASDLLTAYLKQSRHRISDNPGTSLFPKQNGGARSAGNLSAGISERIYRETGLEVHAHLFRHFAAKLYLERKPGDYENVKRMLGHKKLDTTMTSYARLTSKRAFEEYDSNVLSHFRGRRDD